MLSNRLSSRLRRLRASLRGTTLAGFVAAILAVLGMAALSYRALGERNERARRVADTLSTTKHVEALFSILKDAETGQRGYLLTDASSYLEPYEAALTLLPRELEVTRRALGDDLAQLERLKNFELLAMEKLREMRETLELARAGQREAAAARVRGGAGKEVMDRIRIVIGTMTAWEQHELDVRLGEAEHAQWQATMVTWLGSGFLLFLIIAAAFMSEREMRRQQIDSWLQTGQNELGRQLAGERNLNSVGETAASFLARYLEALQVVISATDHGRDLRVVGSWGLPKEALQPSAEPRQFGLGDQALRDNRAIEVEAVPEDYPTIRSAIGKRRPRRLIVAPATCEGFANGVIELGFFRPPSDHERELVKRAAEQVGVAFRAAAYRADLQELVERTQRQAGELQAQQEELRTSNEELEQQARALQQSQGRLLNQQSELEEINAQLEEQTQSLAHQRDQLALTQGDLVRSNSYKSEFLANMSHELRTPLNSSLILAKLLADNRDRNLTPEQVKFAKTIYSAGNDLLTLINDILDLSKIEAGKLEMRPEEIVVARLFDELRDTFLPVASEKKLTLTTEIAATVAPTLFSDPTRLVQILRNLLSNALKFTDRGGVALTLQRLGDGWVAFAVKDSGIGIPASQHQVVFEAFRQADGTTNRKYGGTGLGLSISRDLARLLGGELTLESAPGQGSTFTLVLPERYGGVAAVAAAPTGLSPPPSSAATPVAPTSPVDDRDRLKHGGRTILIVEDDPAFARIVEALAHELDFQALVATSADEALKMAERYRPSAVLLDVGLPDRSGLSVLDELKRDPKTRHLPVHIISASDHRQAALQMGATGFAIKPVRREELIEALEHLGAKLEQRHRRVLVVEDDDTHRESTCRLLAADGVEIVPATNAAEALAALGGSTFDCMVLDLELGDQSGFDLLEQIAGQERCSVPPVIVYTGRLLSRDEEQRLSRFSRSIILKGARSPERLLDEVTLFLHQVESELPAERQRMLREARHREALFEGRRVLVVEDDVRNIFALTSLLEPKGATVEIARNGREALEHLAAKPGVDLVLMDIMMPEMDGLEATREIRKQPALAKLPIIALTAKAMADDRDRCLAAGANDYIAKPLDVDKLLSLARVWMPK